MDPGGPTLVPAQDRSGEPALELEMHVAWQALEVASPAPLGAAPQEGTPGWPTPVLASL